MLVAFNWETQSKGDLMESTSGNEHLMSIDWWENVNNVTVTAVINCSANLTHHNLIQLYLIKP